MNPSQYPQPHSDQPAQPPQYQAPQPTQGQASYQIPQPQSVPQPPAHAAYQPAPAQPQPVAESQPAYSQPATPPTQQPQVPVDPTYQAYVNYYYGQTDATPMPATPAAQPQPAFVPHQSVEPQPAPAPAPEPPAQTPQTPSHGFANYQVPTATPSPQPAENSPPTTTFVPEHHTQPQASDHSNAVPKSAVEGGSKKRRFPSKLKPIIGAALVGIAIFAIFNSQLLVGQLQYLITPKADAEAPSITDSNAISNENVVIIPKINVNVPVVYDITTFNESDVQKGLERGVVHYGTTALPGQIGNNVIVGHSSNNWWAAGKYKFAFVLLDKLENGDVFELHYQGKKYVYEVFSKKTVAPTDVSVLQPTSEAITTLITCTPPGTSWQRLVVQGKQISPSPSTDQPATGGQVPASETSLPSNTPSLWQQIQQRFFGG